MTDRPYCVLIVSNRRADRVITLRTLERVGYDGPWFIVIDDQDPTASEYIEQFGKDRVIIFDKDKYASETDAGDITGDLASVIFARNACWDIARDLGFDYFLVLDDDYTQLRFRREINGELLSAQAPRIGGIFDAMFEFLDVSNAAAVAFSQGGDFIGGVGGSKYRRRVLRKAMQTWFIRTDSTWRVVGRLNDDVNTYAVHGTRGDLFLTVTACSIEQTLTQQADGGMTPAYLQDGTYIKSFYTLMMVPSATTINLMGTVHKRIHHKLSGKHCFPMIIPETYRKPRNTT